MKNNILVLIDAKIEYQTIINDSFIIINSIYISTKKYVK